MLEVTAGTGATNVDDGEASVFVGTEAVLYRIHRRVARVVFLEFDQNGDNLLSRRELHRGLQKLDIHLSTNDMKRLMEVIDIEADITS